MLSTLSSPKPELESTFQEPFSWIWNQPLSMKSELELTDNCSTQNNSSPERRMPPTTSPEDTTPLVRKSLISVWTESESWLTTVLVFKVSWCSTQSVVEQDLVWDHSFSKDSQSITERNPSSASPFIPHLKSQPPSLNHTTPSSQLTHFWNTPMLPLCLITKPSTISAEETSISKDQPTPTWTDSSLKLSHLWLHLWDSMVPWTLISLNSKPTWSHIQESTSCCHLTHLSSQLRRLITNNSQLLKSPTAASSQPTWWPNVTQDTESIWLAPWCTEVMSFQKMSTHQLPPSKPREPFNSSTGAQLDSRSVSTINPQQLSQEEIWPRLWEHAAWSPTPPPLLKSSQDSITSSTWCTPREPSSTGTSDKVWKKENSPKPEKIWLPLKRTTKKSELKPLKDKDRKKVD